MMPFDTPGGRRAAATLNALIRLFASAMLLASAAVAEPQWRFDFGSGEAAPGAVKVEHDTLYTRERGYGFEPVASAAAAGALFQFSVAVPEGEYRVSVVLGRGSEATVKAESRRLMLEHVAGRVRRSFVVDVRNASLPSPPPNAPGSSQVRLYPRETATFTWDDKLTLSFGGRGARRPPPLS